MSWDLIVLDFGGPPPSLEEADALELARPLGALASVRDRIDAQLPGVAWTHPDGGVYEGAGFFVEIDAGGSDPVASLVLHVRVQGGGDPTPALAAIASANGWTLLDTATGDFLDPAAAPRLPLAEAAAFEMLVDRIEALDAADETLELWVPAELSVRGAALPRAEAVAALEMHLLAKGFARDGVEKREDGDGEVLRFCRTSE